MGAYYLIQLHAINYEPMTPEAYRSDLFRSLQSWGSRITSFSGRAFACCFCNYHPRHTGITRARCWRPSNPVTQLFVIGDGETSGIHLCIKRITRLELSRISSHCMPELTPLFIEHFPFRRARVNLGKPWIHRLDEIKIPPNRTILGMWRGEASPRSNKQAAPALSIPYE